MLYNVSILLYNVFIIKDSMEYLGMWLISTYTNTNVEGIWVAFTHRSTYDKTLMR